MAVWMVREGREGIWVDLALEKSLIGLGWIDMPDLGQVKASQEIYELCRKVYPNAPIGKLKNSTAQLNSFRFRMKKNDLVLMPLRKRAGFAVGLVTGDYQYRNDLSADLRHIRSVKWIKTDLARTVFGQDLLYMLGYGGTISEVRRNNAEQRVRAVLETGQDPGYQETEDQDETLPEEGATAIADIEQLALDQIMSHIEVNFKGHEFARLVDAVLRSQGYITELSAPGPDGGVDILAGKGVMGFESPRLCVQVKSSQAAVDVNVLRALQGTMGTFKADQGLLVSWGGFTGPVEKEARHSFFQVRLWNRDDLVQAVLDNYDRLPEDLKPELPLKKLWALVVEE